MNEKPIFILGSHKSGTTLLRNIFDGHSKIWANPIEAHFFKYFGEWVSYDYRASFPLKKTNQEIISELISLVKKRNNINNPLAGSQTKGYFDIEAFIRKINEIDKACSRKEIIDHFFNSLYFSLYHKELHNNKRILHKSVGLGEFALEINKLFPNAKFIHIIRNPYSNLVSFRKFFTENGSYPLLNRMIKALNNNYYFLHKNKSLIKNYYVVKYEDLVSDFENELSKIIKFLNINDEEILKTPTSAGKAWQGNSTTKKKFKKVSSSHLNVWKEKIHPIEAYYVNNNFEHILKDFGYEKFTTKKSILLPAPKENIIRYMYNRIFMFYNRYYEN